MKLFEIKTVNAPIISTLIDAMRDTLSDTTFNINKNGIKVTDLDTTQSVLVKLQLDKDKFEDFLFNEEVEMSVEMNLFHKILKRVGTNDSLILSMDDSNRDRLNIRIDNSKNGSKSIGHMKLSDLDTFVYDIEDINFDTVITLPSQDFQQICRDMKDYSDKIIITKVENELQFSCESDASNTIDMQIKYPIHTSNDADGFFYLKNEKPEKIIRGVFLLEHLLSFTKCTNLCNFVELYLNNDCPLVVKYSVADMGTIHFCLAPKI